MGLPAAAETFSAGGLLHSADAVERVQSLMRRLSARVVRGHELLWTDTLAPTRGTAQAKQPWENPDVPSGYTYLLQLIAHDLVASSVSQSLHRDTAGEVENTRARPLLLDTIYGGGPEVTPHAYEFSEPHRRSEGLVPRTKLRLGPPRTPFAGPAQCPFRDIGRAMATDTVDSGRQGSAREEWLTEALVADPRNDSHALLSQMTVLFHTLHNQIVDALSLSSPGADTWRAPELAYRRFLCARLAVTMIYRAVIEKDVLARILHPDVYGTYQSDPGLVLDPSDGVTREFSYGAFRFGHALIRDQYLVNGVRPQDTARAIAQSTTRTPGMVPIRKEWLIDWSRFFETGSQAPNLSRRIGPDYPFVLQVEDMFPAIDDGDGAGLAFRDYMSASFAGLRHVPDLCRQLARLVPDYEIWKEPMRAWLRELPGAPGVSEPLTDEDIERIVADPPLPFFVQLEAAHAVVDGKPVRAGGGRHLGALGSVIVADTMLGAMRRHPVGFESAGVALSQRLAACAKATVGDETALALLAVPAAGGSPARDIACMADVIAFIGRQGGFPPSPSA